MKDISVVRNSLAVLVDIASQLETERRIFDILGMMDRVGSNTNEDDALFVKTGE